MIPTILSKLLSPQILTLVLSWFIMFKLIDFTNLFTLTLVTPWLIFLSLSYFLSRIFIFNSSRKVYLLDFACCKPPATQAVCKEETIRQARARFKFDEETLDFMKATIERSGLGDSTYFPRSFFSDPPNLCLDEARRESEMVIFSAVEEVLTKTGVKCGDIGILVVNCCIFSVVPSLSSMIVNKFKLRDTIASYNLSGMGCTAGLMAINLVNHLLQVHPNTYALVVSTENLTQNCYMGNDRSKVLINCVFRVGGAAILLSNHASDRRLSKYQLIHSIQTNTASSDSSYNCIFGEEDQEGNVGVTITKDLLAAAVKAIESNITTLGPLVLPLSEQFYYVLNYVMRRIRTKKIKKYVPNFGKCFDHFLPHVGGKPVLDALEKNLKLGKDVMEASRMTLYRFGNTSSSTVWYELAYVEAKGRIKRGDRVWHMAFGSGFKCSSVIWRAIIDVDPGTKNAWTEEIDGFPVDLNTNETVPYFFEPTK